jgi:competence protein ComEC
MLTFGSTSLVSVPANVAGGFVLGPIMFLGMLSLLLGFIGGWVSVPLNLLAGLFIGFLLAVARVFGRLPWAVYEWQGLSLGMLLAAGAAVLVAGVRLLARRAGQGLVGYVGSPGRATPLIIVSATVLAAVLLLAPAGPAAPAQPTLTFLDVGEGAATLLQVPSGPTVLVDAGPAPLARELREHAVRRIDLLVLSHGHADHTAGLEDVIGAVPIQVALLPQPPEPSAALERLAGELRAAGTEVRRIAAPLSLGGEGWGLRVLPTQAPDGEEGNQSENDSALVVLAELGGQRVLLPGDAEGEVLAGLDLPPCALVGVPHHGSRGGLDAELLAALAPRLAVIPVGENTYGHPTPEMLALLAAAGVPCARTDQYGDVAVTAEGEGLAVRVEHGAQQPR